MNERIARLVKAARSGEIFPPCVKVEYDEFDLKLADPLRIAKRLSEYMEAQPCYFTEDNELLGMIHFDCSVEADLFPRTGHRFFSETSQKFYCKPQENLCTFEWQHSNADFGKVIRIGLEGFRKEIIESRKKYTDDLPRLNFLAGLEAMIRGIVRRAQQYAAECRKQADHFYLVPDQETEEDARGLLARFGGLRFLTGGSGLMEAIAADCPRTGAGGVPIQGEGYTFSGWYTDEDCTQKFDFNTTVDHLLSHPDALQRASKASAEYIHNSAGATRKIYHVVYGD